MEFRLFVIDSSPAIRRLVEEAASTEGFEMLAFSDGPSALDEASRNRPQMVIADYHLEGLTFTTFCERLRDLDLVPAPLVIVLMNSSDRCDEQALRARGVSAFVHKPVQVEGLRQTIKELNEARLSETKPKPPRPRKAWPPESMTMGDEDAPTVVEEGDPLEIREPARSFSPMMQPPKEDLRPAAAAVAAAAAHRDRAKAGGTPPAPAPAAAVNSDRPPLEQKPVASPPRDTPAAPRPVVAAAPPPTLPVSPTAAPADAPHVPKGSGPVPVEASPPAVPRPQPQAKEPVMPAGHADAADGLPRHLEESMQTFISTLLQSLSERSHAELARLVATMVAQHVEAELTRRIRDEVSAQVSAAFPREDLNRAAKQAAEQQLPNVLSTRLGPLEQSLRQDLNEKATHLVEDLTAKLVRDLAGPAVQQQLPEVVRQQLGAMNGLVKEAAKEAATDYAKEAAERIVRQVADEQVSQLASVAVADVAEAQVKKELARLTAD